MRSIYTSLSLPSFLPSFPIHTTIPLSQNPHTILTCLSLTLLCKKFNVQDLCVQKAHHPRNDLEKIYVALFLETPSINMHDCKTGQRVGPKQ
jgi:hypothetical protein